MRNVKLKLFLCAGVVVLLCYGCVRADYAMFKTKYPDTKLWDKL